LARVENVIDTYYEDHLAGTNRAGGSGLAAGRRLPGLGRNLFVGLRYRW